MKTKYGIIKELIKIVCVVSSLALISTGCSKEDIKDLPVTRLKANANPKWTVAPRCIKKGTDWCGTAVKDPSYVDGHVFFTGRGNGVWSIGYASSASTSATKTKLSSLGSGGGIAAPQVFYFSSKGKWFLICQNGTTPSYSTNSNVTSTSGWTALKSMGFSDGGIDYWCISDGTNVYIFYSANNGSHTIKRRSTTVANFPTGWGSVSTVATNVFEAPCVYKNNADGKYYMMVEDMGASRWFDLWTASSLGGTWTQVSEKWADISDCTFSGEKWTTQISHGEIQRAGTDEKLAISNIDACTVLIQGIPSGASGNYADLPYEIGSMHN